MARAVKVSHRGEQAAEAASAGKDRIPFAPLPPPVKNRPLLIFSAVLVVGWTLFLAWLALRG